MDVSQGSVVIFAKTALMCYRIIALNGNLLRATKTKVMNFWRGGTVLILF